MSVNLTKGAKVDLTKNNPGLQSLMVGLGWDESNTGKKGFLGFGKPAAIDCDASVILINANGNVKEAVFYGQLKNSNGSIIHQGDNLTGAGDGDDEQILVKLSSIPLDVEKLVFVVNIYDCKNRKQHFGMIENAFVRVVDNDKNVELLKFNLTDDFSGKTALIVGEIYRHNGEWKFSAVGQGTNAYSLRDLLKMYK